MQMNMADFKKQIYQFFGFPHKEEFLELDHKLAKLERDIDRYKARLRNKRLRQSYEEIMQAYRQEKKQGSTVSENMKDEKEESSSARIKGKATSLLPQVLVFDPEEDTHQSFEEALKDKFGVLTASSFDEVWQYAEENNPVFFFFERSLLASSETKEFLERLQQEHPTMKFVGLHQYLSGVFGSFSSAELHLAGSIQKPISRESLEELLAS